MNYKVLIPERFKKKDVVFEQNILGDKYDISTPCATTASHIKNLTWEKTNAIIAWHEMHYTEEVIKKLTNCKIIVRAGVGFDNVDLAAAGKMGILVCNVPDYGTNDVADHAMALILSLTRGIMTYTERVRESNSWNWSDAGYLKRIHNSILGIIGLGRIGTATALRAKAFGMQVQYFDPYLHDGFDKALGVKKSDELNKLLKISDIVSIHVPLTIETCGMANKEFMQNMKKGGILINTARGEIVNLDALYNGLKSGHIRSAGLDVLSSEPPEPQNQLIQEWRQKGSWLHDRLIVTPHAAFYNEESYMELRTKAAMTVKNYFMGKTIKNIVNKKYINNFKEI